MNLVYSTETGKICPDCRKPADKCSCKKKKKNNKAPYPDVKNDGVVRLILEKKGRKGKGVTLVTGLMMNEEDLKDFSKNLKKKCATGGSVKNGIIEIQGDNRDLLKQELEKSGYKVKIAGA